MRNNLLLVGALALACCLTAACDVFDKKEQPDVADPGGVARCLRGQVGHLAQRASRHELRRADLTVTPVERHHGQRDLRRHVRQHDPCHGHGHRQGHRIDAEWNAQGSVSQGGINCPFTFTNGKTTEDAGGIKIVYTGPSAASGQRRRGPQETVAPGQPTPTGSRRTAMQDLRDAFRALKATPVVTLVAILSLALGIGANTAIFSILDSLMLRALPVREPQRLVLLGDGHDEARTSWTNPIWEQVRERQRLFDGAFVWSSTRFNLAQGGPTELVDGMWASGGLFDVLGVPAILGRTFTEADDRRGGGPDGPVAVISYSFWQRRFGGAADAIGRSLTVERVPFTIVGVAPPDFFGVDVGRTFDVAIPIGTEPLIRGKESSLDRRSNWWLNVMIRLKAGSEPRGAATRRSGASSRRSAKPRCRRTGARRTRTHTSGRASR